MASVYTSPRSRTVLTRTVLDETFGSATAAEAEMKKLMEKVGCTGMHHAWFGPFTLRIPGVLPYLHLPQRSASVSTHHRNRTLKRMHGHLRVC